MEDCDHRYPWLTVSATAIRFCTALGRDHGGQSTKVAIALLLSVTDVADHRGRHHCGAEIVEEACIRVPGKRPSPSWMCNDGAEMSLEREREKFS